MYDASGERTLKRTAQGETFYVNAYYVIREGEVASKHFFTGSQRIATKMVKKEQNGNSGNIVLEKEQYYYHPDHLGSSSFVTDEKGKVYEHLEYFPFGETFAHEHSNTQVTPYKFTGKELDEVTGLYYYGARYYDPRTSVWQSPDPILGEYMSGQTNGGVFNPKNLGLFTYTYNNPVNLVDPNGETPWDVADVVFAGLSWADFADDPSLGNLGWAALDTVALLPIVPSTGYFRRGAELASDVAASSSKADFYVKSSGDVIPSTGYRAVSGPGADAAKKGDLMSPKGDTYFTFDNPSGKSAGQLKSELQIPNKPTHVGEFDTLQIIDDINVPNENWGKGTKPEPITNYFGPNNPEGKNFGQGGATQAITNTPIKNYDLKEVK